jgi:hypothetical protein
LRIAQYALLETAPIRLHDEIFEHVSVVYRKWIRGTPSSPSASTPPAIASTKSTTQAEPSALRICVSSALTALTALTALAAMLPRMVPENSIVFWPTQLMRARVVVQMVASGDCNVTRIAALKDERASAATILLFDLKDDLN